MAFFRQGTAFVFLGLVESPSQGVASQGVSGVELDGPAALFDGCIGLGFPFLLAFTLALGQIYFFYKMEFQFKIGALQQTKVRFGWEIFAVNKKM